MSSDAQISWKAILESHRIFERILRALIDRNFLFYNDALEELFQHVIKMDYYQIARYATLFHHHLASFEKNSIRDIAKRLETSARKFQKQDVLDNYILFLEKAKEIVLGIQEKNNKTIEVEKLEAYEKYVREKYSNIIEGQSVKNTLATEENETIESNCPTKCTIF